MATALAGCRSGVVMAAGLKSVSELKKGPRTTRCLHAVWMAGVGDHSHSCFFKVVPMSHFGLTLLT